MSTTAGHVTEVREYMERAGGGRTRSFDIDGIEVMVTPSTSEKDERARQVIGALRESAATIACLERELRAAKALAPPRTATRLLTAGCVRQQGGRLWLLNRREGGFASFAFDLISWDNLLRHYDVDVYEAGTDEHGPFWMVRNRAVSP